MTPEIDHPFSHSVRLPKINEWTAGGKWLTRTLHKFADFDLLKFCLPNAKSNTPILNSVDTLPKSSLGFPPFCVASSSVKQQWNTRGSSEDHCPQLIGWHNRYFSGLNYKITAFLYKLRFQSLRFQRLYDIYSTVLIRWIWCSDHNLRCSKKLSWIRKHLDQEDDSPMAKFSFFTL